MSLTFLSIISPGAKISNSLERIEKGNQQYLHSSKLNTCDRNSLYSFNRFNKAKFTRLGSCFVNKDSKISCLGRSNLEPSTEVVDLGGEKVELKEKKIRDAVLKRAMLDNRQCRSTSVVLPPDTRSLTEAYNKCGEICTKEMTFYTASFLLSEEKRRAVWAAYAWGKRMDDIVDAPNGATITDLDMWESRLEDLYAGHPFDAIEAALSDTVSKFPIDIQPFKDVIEGMRWDVKKLRYKNFDELYLYSYYVAGSSAFMAMPIFGLLPSSTTQRMRVYKAILALAIASQLTNILRDVGEDAKLGRIYLPQDELKLAGLSDEDILAGKVTDKWRSFMKSQIKRARMYYNEAEKGFNGISSDSRWPLRAGMMMYRQILNEIEANDYNNFSIKAGVNTPKRILFMLISYAESLLPFLNTSFNI